MMVQRGRAADIWLSALRIISRHEGESIYDADSPIYVELERRSQN